MLQFLFPLGLLALFSLVAPIAIHLLSRRPGKTVKVGSLKFLEASESRHWRSLKFTDIPLLLLRLALIAMLALLLAEPFWQKSTDQATAENQGWVLVPPEFINQPHDPQIDQLVDSLVAAGNELHLLVPDFPSVQTTSERFPDHHPDNYWSLLREIDIKLPAGIPLWIFAPDRLSFFRGARPILKRTAHWLNIPGPRENRWLQQAHHFSHDSAQLVIGFSGPRQTSFIRRDFRLPNQPTVLSDNGVPALEISPEPNSRNYKLSLLEKDSYSADDWFTLSASVDSTAMIILYDTKQQDDARYVRTALETVSEFGRLPVIIKSQFIRGNSEAITNSDWVFWLAEQPIPQSLLQQIERGLCLISNAGSQEYESVESFIMVKARQSERAVSLSRRVAATRDGVALWADGFGEPLLEAERRGKGWHYRFHSRFHPAWNELVLNAAFPEWLYSLLSRHQIINPMSDQRRVSTEQSQPKTQASAATISSIGATSLHFPFWIVAVILFAVERWLAERTKRS